MESRKLNKYYIASMVSSLDRHLDRPIKSVMDIVEIFMCVDRGRHELIPAVHGLLNFAKLKGYDRGWIETLKEGIPKREINADLKIPSEEDIINSLRIMKEANPKYNLLFNLLLDSGLRVTEAVKVLDGFELKKLERVDRFFITPVGMFRRSKIAYYCFLTEHTLSILKRLPKEEKLNLNAKTATRYIEKMGAVCSKYIRKFVFDKMTSLGVPETVADFIEGRTPKTVGGRHYMLLFRQAKQHYSKYEEYLRWLRTKASI